MVASAGILLPLLLCIISICANAFVPPSPIARHHLKSPSFDRSSSSKLRSSIDDDDKDKEEWRAFRARLVQNGLPSLDSVSSSTDNSENDGQYQYAHITTPLVEIGSLLLSIPTTDLCQALEQQHWHRSVVLITDVTNNTVNGELIENSIPQEQLADGDKRGRWSYRGLLLNRCTDLLYADCDNMDENDRGWKVHRGGDLLGLDSTDGTDFSCLYMSSGVGKEREEGMSTRLVGNLSYMKLEDAQSLCKDDPLRYSPNDFFTFGGFCSWRPGQLEREMGEERQEWAVLSVDEKTIWDELRLQTGCAIQKGKDIDYQQNEASHTLLEAGTNMWRNYLDRVDMPESKATERLPAGQLDFYDQMLEVWAEDNLNVNHKDATTTSEKCATTVNDSSGEIRAGTLVRATSPPSNDMLLYEAEFIRSLILVLEDTSEATVGIVLNHLMPAAIEVKEGEDPLPLRYGGPVDVLSWRYRTYHDDQEKQEEEPEEEFYDGFLDYQKGETIGDIIFDEVYNDEEVYDDDSSFIWIHRDPAVGVKGPDSGGGSRLGTANLWLINEDDALTAIQSGSLCLEDVMVFSGVCIWEKGPDLGVCGGGLREQIDVMHSLEVVDDGDVVESIWDILCKRQQILTKETLESNTDATIAAWDVCSNKSDPPLSGRDASRVQLADAALKAWIGRSLLEDPLGTFVEVSRNDQREGLFE